MLMPCTKSAPDFSGKIRELLFNSELKIEQTRIMYVCPYEPIHSRLPQQSAATLEFMSEYFNVQSIETGNQDNQEPGPLPNGPAPPHLPPPK